MDARTSLLLPLVALKRWASANRGARESVLVLLKSVFRMMSVSSRSQIRQRCTPDLGCGLARGGGEE
jgi:hypothetical protein